MSETAFVAALALIAYTTIVFPAVVFLRSIILKRPVALCADTPRVSVIIAARNEASVIRRKLESILAADYPADRLQVVVVSDGSTDETESVVRSMGRVLLLSVPALGKADALAAGVSASNGEVLVFTDANGVLEPGALKALVAPFGDPVIGGVAGDQRYPSADAPSGLGSGERSYWNVDRLLKRIESLGGDVVAATGGFYAIRRELFEPIPRGVNDDLFLSTGVVLRGYRLVFASNAVVFEQLAPSSEDEMRRKVRIITRGVRTVWTRRPLLNPFRFGFYSLQLFSHKVLRWFLVFPLLAIVVLGPLLWNAGLFYRVVTVPLIGTYALGSESTGILPARLCARIVPAMPSAYVPINGTVTTR